MCEEKATDKIPVEQIEKLKSQILNGDFLCNTYLAQYSPVDCINPLRKFCLYRADLARPKVDMEKWEKRTGVDVSAWVDNDVSLAAVVTYCLMYNWMGDFDRIHHQPKNKQKYQIQVGKYIYRGDALTSAWTIFRKYLESLWLSEKSSEQYRRCMDKYFDRSKGKMKTKPKSNEYKEVIDSYYTEKDPEKYKLYFSEEKCLDVKTYFPLAVLRFPELFTAIEQEISIDAKKFLEIYMMAGNFIAVPEYFNIGRSNDGEWDTVDRMLWKIYQYFENGKDEDFLHQMFTKEVDIKVAVSNCLGWFEDAGINEWKDFVCKNLLQPFVDEDNDWRPISLKDGQAIELDIKEDYAPMQTISAIDEFETFFKTANRGILERNELVWERCKESVAKK